MDNYALMSNQTLAKIKSNMIFKVAMYIRLSREDGDKEESSSVTNQRNIITRFINENDNFIIVDEYVDDGYTGTNFNRPAFQRMIKDIEKGKINTVITKDLSRLGRDYIDTGRYVQRYFPENRVRYIALLDGIDTLEDAGMNDIAPFKSVINDMYVKDISKKITSALKERKTAGNFLAVTAPYGYKKNPENKYQLVINEEEAKVVRYIFRLYLQGNGLTKIAKILTEEEIPVPGISRNIGTTRKTKLYNCWKQTTISRILKNPVYIGNLEQFKRKKVNYKSKKRVSVPKEDRVICYNTHEPIIKKEDFDEVQKIITENKAFSKSTKHDYLFKGFLYCADCGAKLYLTYSDYAYKKYGEYRYTTVCYTYSKYYNQCSRHSNSIPILEKILIENIKKVCNAYLNRDLEKELIEMVEKENKRNVLEQEYNKKIDNIETKIEDLNLCIRNLYMDKVKNVITEKDYIELSKNFTQERDKLINEKEELLKLSTNLKNDNNNKEEIEKVAKEFVSLKKPTKELLSRLIDKVTISEDNIITIYFKFKELTEISQMKENKMEQCKTVNKRNKKTK
jgi:DNA invertase Pin-like site-specific DNA recombinase